jgi:hypothetical protein
MQYINVNVSINIESFDLRRLKNNKIKHILRLEKSNFEMCFFMG